MDTRLYVPVAIYRLIKKGILYIINFKKNEHEILITTIRVDLNL